MKKIKSIKNTCLKMALIMILFNGLAVKAQSDLSNSKVSIKVLGPISLGLNMFEKTSDNYPIISGLEINTRNNQYAFTAGYYRLDELLTFFTPTIEKYNHFNFLIGKYNDNWSSKLRFQYQMGLGLAWGTIRTDRVKYSSGFYTKYFVENYTTINAPIRIGGQYIPFKFLSIGYDLMVNLNLTRTNVMPMLSIEIGPQR